MLDLSVVSLITAGVALAVGLFSAVLNRRTTFDAVYRQDRAKALLRVLNVVETHSSILRDRVFNLTEARPRTFRFGQSKRTPYAPPERPHRDTDLASLAEARALMAAYGTPDIDRALVAWFGAVDRLDLAFLDAEVRWSEAGEESAPEHFAEELADEDKTRAALGTRIRSILSTSRGRRRLIWPVG